MLRTKSGAQLQQFGLFNNTAYTGTVQSFNATIFREPDFRVPFKAHLFITTMVGNAVLQIIVTDGRKDTIR